jgi:hypothetical protein
LLKNSKCYHQSPKMERLKVHLSPMWVLEN